MMLCLICRCGYAAMKVEVCRDAVFEPAFGGPHPVERFGDPDALLVVRPEGGESGRLDLENGLQFEDIAEDRVIGRQVGVDPQGRPLAGADDKAAQSLAGADDAIGAKPCDRLAHHTPAHSESRPRTFSVGNRSPS